MNVFDTYLKNYKIYLTKKNITYALVIIYIILSGISLTSNLVDKKNENSWVISENSSQTIQNKEAPTWKKILNGISSGIKQIFCPFRYIIYIVWFSIAILIFILAFLFDLVTLFNFGLIGGSFDFISSVSTLLITFFENLC
jgi:uncharacterized membrane protein